MNRSADIKHLKMYLLLPWQDSRTYEAKFRRIKLITNNSHAKRIFTWQAGFLSRVYAEFLATNKSVRQTTGFYKAHKLRISTQATTDALFIHCQQIK